MVRARQGSHAEASQRHHMTGKCMKWLKVEMFLIRLDKGYEAKGMVFHDDSLLSTSFKLFSTSFKGKVKSLSVMRDATRTRQEIHAIEKRRNKLYQSMGSETLKQGLDMNTYSEEAKAPQNHPTALTPQTQRRATDT